MPGPPGAPPRVLTLTDATCIVIGAIVGVGIFFNPSRTAALTGSGPLLLLAWGIAGVIALCGALTFAELGGLCTGGGAQYQILRDAYGPLPAFLFVFCNATAVQAGAIGVIAIVCVDSLAAAMGRTLSEGPTQIAAALAVILGLTGANILGVRWGSRIQNITVYAKILTLAAVVAVAIAAGRADIAAPPAAPHKDQLAPFPAILSCLVPALFAFGGWQQALWISGEVKEPARNLPRAIIIGVLLVIAVYLSANWAYLRLLSVGGMAGSSTLAADAVSAVLPNWCRRIVAAAVALSAFGVLNSQLLTGPRLIFEMAQDGRFFAPFASLGRRGTPAAAIALLTGMAVLLLLLAAAYCRARSNDLATLSVLDQLTTGAVFIDAAFFILTGAALLVLRRKRPEVPRPFRVPLYPIVPLLFVIGETGVAVGAYIPSPVRAAAIVGLVWITAAAVLYLVRFRSPITRSASAPASPAAR